jgi:hypothetical protein
MALFQRWAGGERPTATKMNETSIPVVATTADISAPYTGQIVFATTNLKLYRYTGAAWAVYVGGPTWSLTDSTPQTFSNATFQDMLWDTEINDSDNMHVSNSVSVITTVPGLYAVTTKMTYASNATGARGAQVLQNGVVVTGSLVVVGAVSGNVTSVVVPTLNIPCAAGDTLKVQGYQSSTGNLDTVAGAVTGNWCLFTGAWLHD